MLSACSLSALTPGQSAVIQAVRASGAMLDRLLDLGFTERTPVRCLFRSVLGSPLAYGIRGTVVALRTRDASMIDVLPTGAGGKP